MYVSQCWVFVESAGGREGGEGAREEVSGRRAAVRARAEGKGKTRRRKDGGDREEKKRKVVKRASKRKERKRYYVCGKVTWPGEL